jgi:hypothetical protein
MGTLIIILFTLLALANGVLLTHLVLKQASLRARLAAGAVVGLALLAWVGFLAALVFGLNWISISVTAVILLSGLFALLRFVPLAQVRAELNVRTLSKGALIYYAAWTALLVWLFSRVVMFYPDGLHTAPANNYGDLPFHFSVITSLAYGENLPPQSPIFAGMKFTYPFLIDFLTAFFIRCGADWRAAFFVENIVLALALVALIEWLTLQIFNNQLAARLAPVIFLFNGGLGFINFFHQLGEQQGSFSTFIAHLPQTFTMNADLLWGAGKIPLRWGNVFTTLLIPQRSMLFGLPLVALIITLWWLAIGETERRRDGETERQKDERQALSFSPSLPLSLSRSLRLRYLLAAGLLTGLLPMLHAHGFFSVMIVSVPMVLLFWSWDWVAFFAPVAVLAAPQAWWLSGTQVRNKLFEPHWGWDAGEANPFLFWAANAGVFIALLLTGLLIKRLTTSQQARFYLPFVIWFIVPNVVLLAPWPWDNIKVLVYWALASCPFVAAALAYLFARPMITARIAAAALLIVLTLAGALDVWRALSPAENVGLFSQADLEVAALLRAKTEPRAVILHAPIHNSMVALTGRQSVMGYPGHLWTHGIDYGSREQEVRAIYQGGAGAGATLARLNVAYVVIGPIERMQLQPNEDYFNNSYPALIDHAGYRVYQIKPPALSNADVR